MAWSVLTWKILRISQSNYYLERFVPRLATAHIQNRCKQFKININHKNNENYEKKTIIYWTSILES